jgi:hypothetical protein
VKFHSLSAKDIAKAIAVGVVTALILSAIMITGLRTGISPLPAPLALAFANTLLGAEQPLPIGLLFHVAWVTFWSGIYVVLFWDRLTFTRALGLAAVLFALVLVEFFPYVGWGFLGLAVSPMLIMAALVSHVLFAVILWALAHWVFGTYHEPVSHRHA